MLLLVQNPDDQWLQRVADRTMLVVAIGLGESNRLGGAARRVREHQIAAAAEGAKQEHDKSSPHD
jgi:hypothetical protein